MARIAFLTNDDPLQPRGGAAKIVERQVKMLRDQGDEVRVFAPLFDWPNLPIWRRLIRHVADLGVYSHLCREISEWRPEILISHNLTGCGFGTAHAIHASGVRWIHVLHDVQLFEPSGRLRNASRVTIWQKAVSFFRRRVFGHPDLVISPTAWLLQEHRRRGFFLSEPTEVLPNPAPLATIFPRFLHQPLRVLFVGRLQQDKGADVVASLIGRVPFSCVWLLVGEGPLISRFPQDEGVRRLGNLPHEVLLEQMKEADVLLVPSRIEENQPTVILEAASVGLPVIASCKPGIKETLQGRGYLIDVDRPELMLSALASLSDPEIFSAQSEAMYKLASIHDPLVYAERFLTLVKSK
ncbi:MAG TPA: glycosyltransferase, partial [Patescibacteria group bacterium]|nr:glycosyltransferase [Patescibacteria group bacterium]